MKANTSPGPTRVATMTQTDLAEHFLVGGLFLPDRLITSYHVSEDRVILLGVCPTYETLELMGGPALGTEFFCERREIGILNLGAPGTVEVDHQKYEIGTLDVIYIGKGTRSVRFKANSPDYPPKFYGVSYPAHKEFPTAVSRRGASQSIELGGPKTANHRTLHKIIYDEGIQSCQLVMGYTEIHDGSVWNTMPPHTHGRRSEVYLYFNISENQKVFHFMGEPKDTKHLLVSDSQAVVSPHWSLHCGVGTMSYSFCWAMGGENKVFQDMDQISLMEMR